MNKVKYVFFFPKIPKLLNTTSKSFSYYFVPLKFKHIFLVLVCNDNNRWKTYVDNDMLVIYLPKLFLMEKFIC